MNSPQLFRVGAVVLTLVGGVVGYQLGYRYAAITNTSPTSSESTERTAMTQTSVAVNKSIAPAIQSPDAINADEELSPRSLADIRNRLSLVAAVEDASERNYLAAFLFDEMTPEQAPTLLAELLKLPAGSGTRRLLTAFFLQWARLDGPAAVEAARQLDDQQRLAATSTALAAWSENDPMAAWDAARDMARDWPQLAVRLIDVIRQLARHDLAGAVSAHREIDARSAEHMVRQAVFLHTFSEEGNVDATLRAISRFESLEDRSNWISALFSHWATVDETAPLAALQNLTDPVLAEHALAGFLTGWTASDPEAAIDYMLARTDDKTILDSFPGAIRQLTYMGDRSALLAAVQKMAVLENSEFLLEQTIRSLTSYYPEMAVELASTLADERQRSTRTASAMSAWARSDFDAAVAYFETMPQDETKARTLGSMSSSLLPREDGDVMLLKWMNEITDETLRLRTLTLLVRNPNNARPSSSSAAALKQLLEQTPNVPADLQRDAARLLGESVAPTTPTP